MSPTKVNYEDVEPAAPGLYFLRDALGTDQVGVSVLDCEAGWSGMEHDHAADGQEEVYVLLEGAATVAVDGDDVDMEPGDALRLGPETTRTIETDEPSTFVLVGAP